MPDGDRILQCAGWKLRKSCGWKGKAEDCREEEVWAGRGLPGPRMAKRCPECGGSVKAEGVAKVHSVEVGG